MSKEKRRKPLWAKILGWLVGIIFWLGLIFAGVWAFVYFKYNINLFNTFKQLRILSQEVNEDSAYPNKFGDADMADAMGTVNSKIAGMIVYDDATGYKVQTDITGVIAGEIKLTDKEMGAIIDNILENSAEGSSAQVGDMKLDIKLIQIEFSNVDNGSADVNVVVKLDLKPVKEKMTRFPFKMIKNRLPDSLYFSSTVRVVKGTNPFEYTVESKSIKINNLNEKQTEEFLTVINTVLKIGKTKELNEQIAKPLIDGMIGSEENRGFAYSLKDIGAKDYTFVVEGDKTYFVIQII